MKSWINIIKAFLIRDMIINTSYRLGFLMRIIGLLMTVISFYFMSKLVGQHPTLDKYGGYLPFSVIGFAMTAYFTTGFDSFSSAIRNEQMMGTLEALFMTPTRLSKIIFASSVWDFFWTTLNSSLTIGTSSLLFGIKIHGNPFAALLVLILTTIDFSCLGILSACFIIVFKQGNPLRFIANTMTYMFGGVVFPVGLFPLWLQKVSYLLPVTQGLLALREILLLGKPINSVMLPITILACYALIGIPLSLMCFKKAVNVAKREGSLIHY